MAVADTARLIAELSLDSKKYDRGIKNVAAANKRLESSLGKVASGAGKLSAGVTRAGLVVGGAAVAGLTAAAKAAIDWEDAFTGVRKTVDAAGFAPGQSFETLSRALRDMATEMPTTATDLAAIAEAGGAMGIAAKDIEAFTRQVAILGSTTNVSVDDAATALGQMQNIIGLTGDEFDNFAASLVDLGNKGASTEAQILEIARRSGGAAKLFGIAKDATLGWAAAAANLGLNEELAGTALQNVFVKLLPKFTDGSKELQRITGQSARQIKKAFKEDAGGALESLMKQLGGLPKDQRLRAIQSLFGKGSGITRLVNGLAESYAKNLAPSLDTATDAWADATAAQIEFDKRNANVKSAFARLRNGVMDAAITVGEGFTPALGRAADKLSTFLKSDANRNALKSLGEDIGKAIDGINWQEVLDGARTFMSIMKDALGWAKRLVDALNALPTPVKSGGLAFLGLDKLSGGLISGGLGSIASGLLGPLVRNLGASLPGVGKAFVQPVLVTNFPPGLGGPGSGGLLGAAGKGGGLVGLITKGIGIASIVSSVAGVIATQQEISGASSKHASDVRATSKVFLEQNPTTQQLQSALAGVEQGIADLRGNPLHMLVQGDALATLQQTKADINTKLAANALEVQRQGERNTTAVDAAKQAQTLRQQETTRETARSASAIQATQRTAAFTLAASQMAAASGIIAAIYANRPQISVTNVTRTYNKVTRYGPTSSSKNANAADTNFGPT